MRILLLCLMCLCGMWANTQQIFFMPYEREAALKALKKELANAQTNIKISIYSFTNKEISKTLRDVARKGVRVELIYDYEGNYKNPQSSIGYLAALRNISACVLKGRKSNRNYYGIMHQKLAIIDNKVLILGSANWSKSAFENNYEVLMITHNQANINKALEYFNLMKKECIKY